MEAFGQFRNDDWAKEVISSRLCVESGTAIKGMGKKERDQALRQLKEAGMTIRQIERLTGISKSVAQRA